ncbi:MAG: levanase [Azospira oryzae]|jgi:fructan beta-fructosidase|nr:MAG: levanase [Azospira oryzae]
MMNTRSLLALLLSVLLLSCEQKKTATVEEKPVEEYRPAFHFTPPQNWTNDPNGLVFYDGEYHLFYQYNPYGMTWGHMSWGHAVSKDLLTWEHLPVALPEFLNDKGDSTMIFSGTTVVDNNTSGLCEGKDCLVAVYTAHIHKNGEGLKQYENLAYSNDKGRTWKQYDKNPVLDIGLKDFRDPKIFWHDATKKWVMVLVVPDKFKVQLYESTNLTQWKLLSEFGNTGDAAKIWECPDLYQLPVENEQGKKKWVLSLSGSHPAGPRFVGMQYFVGEFDGNKFIQDKNQPDTSYVEYGKDFYAGIVYNHLPAEDRAVMIGWANNWAYGNKIPTVGYRGAMSLPRELSLKKVGPVYKLIQKPIREAVALRDEEIKEAGQAAGKQLEIELDLAADTDAGIKVFKSGDEETSIGYNSKTKELFIDRTKSGKIDFHPDFSSIDRVPVDGKDGKVHLHIFLDSPIIEVFANEGEAVLTETAFASGNEFKIEPYGNTTNLKVWKLKSKSK